MKRIKRGLFFILSMGFAGLLWAGTSPVPMLQNTADKIIKTLSENKGQLESNKNIIYSSVRKNLLPIVDVQGMARSVLGRQAWRKASASERKAFTQEFTNLVIRTYASPLAKFSDEKVKFLPVRGDLNKRFVRVNSLIVRSSGPNIPLNYSLVSKKGQWKVYDMSVEGVSLLQSFRSQFAQSLQNSNMQTLIKEMKQHQAG